MQNHILENDVLALVFDLSSTSLVEIINKLTGERFSISGDKFEVECTGFHFDQDVTELENMEIEAEVLKVRFRWDDFFVDVSYSLKPGHHFCEKQLVITAGKSYELKRVILSHPCVIGESLSWLEYRHPSFNLLESQVNADLERQGMINHPWNVPREPNSEPCRTFFGRTPLGGLFAGVELSFDASTLQENILCLSISPYIKVKAEEQVLLEPAYFGVYRRGPADIRVNELGPDRMFFFNHGEFNLPSQGLPANWRPDSNQQKKTVGSVSSVGSSQHASWVDAPLPSESAAMNALAQAVLGPRRQAGLRPVAVGCGCELEHVWEYSTESVEADLRGLDFLTECGIDWITDSRPWGGDTQKLNQLEEDDRYEPGPLVRKFLEGARKRGVKVIQWATMTHTNPWTSNGRSFLQKKLDWLRIPAPEWQHINGVWGGDVWPNFRGLRTMCMANKPYWEWITNINLQALQEGFYDGWTVDGDFWGTGASFQSTVPVDCYANQHDHLPGDANYACQKALEEWIKLILEQHTGTFITMMRPGMDLGVWAQRNVDACFTLIETGTSKSNLAGGNEIRIASRVRVHYHFFPHYIDWPLLFASFAVASPNDPPKPWWGGKLDYILLSAMSCSPNMLFYLPARNGIPDNDKAEIRKWLEWGRRNIGYLQIRKDLFDWPAPGKVDGSAHLMEHAGIIFLFNPNPGPLPGIFDLTEEIGLPVTVSEVTAWQEYPFISDRQIFQRGESVHWEVPAETAVVLRLEY